MSKNIWIVNQYSGSIYHGMNYRSYYLAKELLKSGYKVTIFSGSYSHLFTSYPNTKGLFTKENIDGIDYIWVKTPKYKSSKSIGRIINMLIFMINLFFFNTKSILKPDIIIVSSLSLFPIFNAYLWSKKLKVDFIFEVRDLWPQTLIEIGNLSSSHPLVKFFGWFEKLGYKNTKYVVSLLPNAKKYMVDNGLKENKFIYIPNGINMDEVKKFEDIDDDIKQLIPKDKFTIGYVGTIGIANALEYLIKAIKELKGYENIYFIIVGKGSKKEKLKQFVDKNNLTNVTFIDPIPKIQVQGMLKYIDICYIGWKKESIYKYGISANKLFDYMYAGKPILHSFSGEGDIVKLAKCGISVEAENVDSIKKGILELYNMQKKDREILGQNGKKYVLKYHTYENIARKYMELFK